jgi:hypothetical protein
MAGRRIMGAIAITAVVSAAGCESISKDGTEWVATPALEMSASESAEHELAGDEMAIGSARQALTGTHKACQCTVSVAGGPPLEFHSLLVNNGWTSLACSNYCATKVVGATHGRLSCIFPGGFVNAPQRFAAGSAPLPGPSPHVPTTNCGW